MCPWRIVRSQAGVSVTHHKDSNRHAALLARSSGSLGGGYYCCSHLQGRQHRGIKPLSQGSEAGSPGRLTTAEWTLAAQVHAGGGLASVTGLRGWHREGCWCSGRVCRTLCTERWSGEGLGSALPVQPSPGEGGPTPVWKQSGERPDVGKG